jgi:hypothetical protein
MRWTLAVRLTSALIWRTAKTCGPDTPTLVSSLRINPRNDGGKKADHRGERGISRKPLRAGMSGVFRWLAVNTRVHTCYPMRTRGCGCIGRPAFPTPSELRGREIFNASGASRREGEDVCGIGAPSLLYMFTNSLIGSRWSWWRRRPSGFVLQGPDEACGCCSRFGTRTAGWRSGRDCRRLRPR